MSKDYTERVEALAALLMAIGSGDPKECTAVLKKEFDASLHNAVRLCKESLLHLLEGGSVGDNARPGRPAATDLITPQQAIDAVFELGRGQHAQGSPLYRTLQQAAQSGRCPNVKAIVDVCAQNHITQQCTVIAAIQFMVGPGLKILNKKITIKYPLGVKHKPDRMRTSTKLLARARADPTFVKRIIQIDSKKLWVVTLLKNTRGIVVMGLALPMHTDPRLLSCKGIAINYYIAVNAMTGLLHCKLVTGTTGLVQETPYMVSVAYGTYMHRAGGKALTGLHAVTRSPCVHV